jgi:hypothetical protein
MRESSTNDTQRRAGRRSPFRFLLAAALVALAAFSTGAVGVGTAGTPGAQYSAGGWELWEFVDSQPACATVAYAKQTLSRSDCAYGYAYLGSAGQLLQTVTALTAPLSTVGFQSLEKTITVPAGVAKVRLVFSGFSALDTSTRGSVTFDAVGLFAH